MKNYVLAFDCSLGSCSVAVGNRNVVIESIKIDPPVDSGTVLVPLIDRCLKQANIHMTELKGIITTRGPGSFTSIRIALSAALGLRFALKIPAIAVTAMDALWSQNLHLNFSEANIVIKALRNQFYIQKFSKEKALTDIELIHERDINNIDFYIVDSRLETNHNTWESISAADLLYFEDLLRFEERYKLEPFLHLKIDNFAAAPIS